MDLILKFIFIILLLLLALSYKDIYISEKFISSSPIDKKLINKNIKDILDRIDKLELILHNKEHRNKVKDKLTELEKKYNESFYWYKNYEKKQKKSAEEVKKNMIKNLI